MLRCGVAALMRERNAHPPAEVTHTEPPVTHMVTRASAADKQRAYRERHADAYKLANRERMRKRRVEARGLPC